MLHSQNYCSTIVVFRTAVVQQSLCRAKKVFYYYFFFAKGSFPSAFTVGVDKNKPFSAALFYRALSSVSKVPYTDFLWFTFKKPHPG